MSDLDPKLLFEGGVQHLKQTEENSGVTEKMMKSDQMELPGYELLRTIGTGGMRARVYLARQNALDRLVVIKFLALEWNTPPDFMERFNREAQTMAKLRHPNIVCIYDFGRTKFGDAYIVMEYIEGSSLEQEIQARTLSIDQAIDITAQISSAIGESHRIGILHRDIHPGNVMLTTNKEVKVADFGLAKPIRLNEDEVLTKTHSLVGVLDYMSPERLDGNQEIDASSDIYSIAVILYQMLTTRLPRGAFPPASSLVRSPRKLDTIIMRAMHADSARRYLSVESFAADLSSVRNARHFLNAKRLIVGGMAFLAIGVAAFFAILPEEHQPAWKKHLQTHLIREGLFVAPSASAGGIGTYEAPFNTIKEALEHSKPGSVIYLRGGVYRETIFPQLSGKEKERVTIRGYPGEQAVISAYDILDQVTWERHQGFVYKTTLMATNALEEKGIGSYRVKVDGDRMREARWPNSESPFVLSSESWVKSKVGRLSDHAGQELPELARGLYQVDELPDLPWKKGTRISLMPGEGWWHIPGILQEARGKELIFSYPTNRNQVQDNMRPASGDRMFLWNSLSALDEPGEFFVDVEGVDGAPHTLYLWLPDNSSPSDHQIEITNRTMGFKGGAGCSFIRLSHLIFDSASIDCDETTKFIEFDTIAVTHLGSWDDLNEAAVSLYGSRHSFINGEISHSLGPGLLAGGDVRIKNNVVHHCVQSFLAMESVPTGSVIVRGNTFFESQNLGLHLGHNHKILIADNHLSRIGGGLATGYAAIWGWEPGNGKGSKITRNWIHDVRPHHGTDKQWRGNGFRIAGSSDTYYNFEFNNNQLWNIASDAVEVEQVCLVPKTAQFGISHNTILGEMSLKGFPDERFHAGFAMYNNIIGSLDLSGDPSLFPEFFTHNHIIHWDSSLDFEPIHHGSSGIVEEKDRGLLLGPGSPVIDQGIELPTGRQEFIGRYPDIGAVEYGSPIQIPGAYVREQDLSQLALNITADLESNWHVEVFNAPLGRKIPATLEIQFDSDSAVYRVEHTFYDSDRQRATAAFSIDSDPNRSSRVFYSIDGDRFFEGLPLITPKKD